MDDTEERKLLKRLCKARESNNDENISKVLRKLAGYYVNHGRYIDALGLYEEELSICERQKDLFAIANANRMIGEMHNMMGRYEESLIYSRLYLEYAKNVKDIVEEQRALATIGRSYFCWASDQEKGTQLFETTIKQCKKSYLKSLYICENELKNIGSREKQEMKAKLLYNLGLVMELEKDYENALTYLSRAISICKSERFYDEMCRAYNCQGSIYMKQDNTALALESYDLGLNAAKSSSNPAENTVITYLQKSECYFVMSNYEGAKNVLKKAYKLKSPNEIDNKTVERQLRHAVKLCLLEEKLKNTQNDDYNQRRQIYEQLGDLCSVVKNYKHGIESYLKMLECALKDGCSGKDLLPCYESLSQTYRDDKQYDTALSYHQKELELYDGDYVGMCKTYITIGEVLELKNADYSEVAEVYDKAKKLALVNKNGNLQVLALEDLIDLQKKHGKVDLVKKSEEELERIKTEYSIDSSSESDDSEEDAAADINLEDVLSNSEQENEEYDRPRSKTSRSFFKIKRNEKGETQLHVAAIKGDVTRARRLIEQGHPVKEQDLNGWTPLHEACNHGHVDIVKLLIDSGANVNDPGGKGCKGITPLHDSASCGHFEVIQMLVERGASIAVLTDAGETPLDCLMDWRKRVNLTKEEEETFKSVRQLLKTSLDRSSFKKNMSGKADAPLLLGGTPPKHRAAKRGSSSMFDNRKTLRKEISEGWGSVSPESKDGDQQPNGSKEKSAEEEYRSAIDGVRKRSKKTSYKLTEKEDVALLHEDNFVDDWLEDDMGVFEQPQKKRKTNMVFNEYNSFKEKKNTEDNDRHFAEKLPDIDTESIPDGLGEEIEESVLTDKPTFIPKPRRKQQLTLLKSGFQKCVVPFPEPEPTLQQLVAPLPVFIPEEPHPIHPLKLKVKVENHLILVPVLSGLDDLNVSWLMEEASKRYYQLEGKIPVLRLKTKDGAILAEDDPVSSVCDEELEAIVLLWKTCTLMDRYIEACGAMSTRDVGGYCCYEADGTPDPQILEALEVCLTTKQLNLEYLALKASDLSPVLSAIKYETKLKCVNLSGNILGDDGLTDLTKCLERCVIEEINLSCNNITEVGIREFCKCFENMTQEKLSCMRSLNFSYNPIGNSIQCLTNLSKLMPNLNELNITHTD